MPWLRYHYHCEACDGSWLAEGDIVVEADCPFCGTRDIFAYKSDDRVHDEIGHDKIGHAERGQAADAAAVAKRLAARMRKAVRKPPAPRAKIRRAG
jgi:predicted  nucleic acid-binding Zn-ribbon protein